MLERAVRLGKRIGLDWQSDQTAKAGSQGTCEAIKPPFLDFGMWSRSKVLKLDQRFPDNWKYQFLRLGLGLVCGMSA
jgi:hypothetical protein